jgi:hypothetical protein
VALRAARPGDFARRLDHLLRLEARDVSIAGSPVEKAFAAVANRVATPLLLAVAHHFAQRTRPSPVRVFFPKGQTARVKIIANERTAIPDVICARMTAIAETALLARFATLPALGRVWIDPALADCPVPTGGRSAAHGARVMARGTKLALPAGDTVRFFVWWRNMTDGERVDLDLTAAFFDTEFRSRGEVAYYELRNGLGHHSGDIVDAPQGASEFIDVDLTRAAAQDVRYVGMVVTSYTRQPFAKLPECFAGTMMRAHPNSGEIYDPRTVLDKIDITSGSTMALPLLIDVVTRQMIWCDLTIKPRALRANAVILNRNTLGHTLAAMVGDSRPNLSELLTLHARARGELVVEPAAAEVSFSVADGFPFRGEEITSQFMA